MLDVSSWSSIQLRTGIEVPPSVTFAPHTAHGETVLVVFSRATTSPFDLSKDAMPTPMPIEKAITNVTTTTRVSAT